MTGGRWLFIPRGCAVLYVPLKHQAFIRSSIPTSHGFVPRPVEGKIINNPLPPSNKSAFVNEFEYVGALDNSPYLCIPESFKFIREVCGGERKIMRYCQNIAKEGGALVATMLGTEVMENTEGTLQNCFFSNVRLPLKVGEEVGMVRQKNRNRATQWLAGIMAREYNTFMAVVFHGGAWWIRFSGQIYLEKKDFEWAGRVLKDVCERVKNEEYLGESST
jgi:hypothetical protein